VAEVTVDKTATDLHEAQIRSRLAAAIAIGNPQQIAAERKMLASIGRSDAVEDKKLAAEERKAAQPSESKTSGQTSHTPPEGRSAGQKSTTQGGTSVTHGGSSTSSKG
jgi:hypothetical protein